MQQRLGNEAISQQNLQQKDFGLVDKDTDVADERILRDSAAAFVHY